MKTIKRDKKEIQNIVGAIRKLTDAISSDSVDIDRKFKLTSSQSRVLRCLYAKGPASSAQMSRILTISPSNMTGIVDRLEKKGLIESTYGEPVPERGGRSKVYYQLTPEGKKALLELKHVHDATWTDIPSLGLDEI